MADSAPPAAAGPSAELVRLQARVAAAPQDFESQCALVSEAERAPVKDVALIREVMRGLLQHFPLCFGYWQRLAKLEAAQTAAGVSAAEAQAAEFRVLEAGLEAIPHSHELWTFLVREKMKSELCTPDEIRSVFVRGSSALSTDSSASAFWDAYLEFELSQFSTPAVQEQLQLLPPPYTGTLIGGLYALILSLPLRDIDRFWSSFSHKFAINYPLNYLASPEEAAQFTADYPTEVPEERKIWTAPDGSSGTLTLTDYVNEWELEQRRQLLAKREYSFRIALALRDEKHLFESAISRPYFHTAPMTPAELSNWSNYLDFMESKLARHFASTNPPGSAVEVSVDTLEPLLLADVIKLFERCLIPCAKYPEFWDRYASFMEGIGESMRAYEVRQRALAFMQRNALPGGTAGGAGAAAVQEQLVALALLEEKQGNFAQARDMLLKATAIPPVVAAAPPVPAAGVNPAAAAATAAAASDPSSPFLEAQVALINFERRQWHASHPSSDGRIPFDGELVSLYQSALTQLDPTVSAAAFAYTKSYTYLSLHFASFLLTQVQFASPDDRVTHVRAVFNKVAACMFPAPVSVKSEMAAPPPVALEDGSLPPAAAPLVVTTTTQPKLAPSKQYLLFWTAFIDFESNVARSAIDVLIGLYERALSGASPSSSSSSPSAALAASPATAVGASGLSDVARKQLWSSYVALMEDRAPSIAQVEVVRKRANTATSSLLGASTPALGVSSSPAASVPLLSSLGKRKHTASPLPLQQAKTQRTMPPPMQQRAPWGGYGGAGGYGGGYAQQGGYQQQHHGGYAAAGGEHAAAYQQQQYGQYQ